MPSSRTPHFDQALDRVYTGMTPHARRCTETDEPFEITNEDIERYRSLRVPVPTTTEYVRLRRLRAAVAGLDLFRRTQPDGTTLITMYDPESPVLILPVETWWNADQFDATTYGQGYDPARSFFDQWKELSDRVPRPALIQDPASENSPWVLYGDALKNCYFTYQGMRNEELQYADFCVGAKSSTDVSIVYYSHHCYDSVHIDECANIICSERCQECSNMTFCLGCRNCQDCFGCTNLRHKKYCFLNEQLTEEVYKKKMAEIDLGDATVLAAWQEKIVKEYWNIAYRKAGHNPLSTNATGDDIVECKDVRGFSMFRAERVYNAFGLTDVKDTLDLALGLELERCVNLVGSWSGYENKMVNTCDGCIDIEYCELVSNCEHCFGCVGIRRKKFCILNRQYTEEEYWPLVDQIKIEMLKRGEYGEFFPYRCSSWAYNTSHSDAQFPLSKAAATTLGARWYDYTQERAASAYSIDELPTQLSQTDDTILTKAYRCPESGRPYLIVKPELAFHRELNIALPRLHPTIRRKQRTLQVLPLALYDRSCKMCQMPVKTRLPPDHPSPLLCEACYEKRILAS